MTCPHCAPFAEWHAAILAEHRARADVRAGEAFDPALRAAFQAAQNRVWRAQGALRDAVLAEAERVGRSELPTLPPGEEA